MSLRVTTSNVKPDIVVLHLSGSMTTAPETDALESLFHELLGRRTTKLVFDLTGIDEIDSGGTLFIVRCFFAARSARSELRFVAVRPEVLRPFKNAMLDTLLPFDARKVKILEHAETMGDWPTRFEGPWQDVTRHFWTRITLCYISNPVAPWTTVQPATMIGFKQIEFFEHTGLLL